jgi:hypothetical protein
MFFWLNAYAQRKPVAPAVKGEIVNPFSICSQMPVFRVFYACVRKMNTGVLAPKQA